MTIERRFFEVVTEVRAASDGDGLATVAGYAVKWNSLSQDFGGMVERFAPYAFTNIDDADVRALWQHDHAKVLGRVGAGTLRLEQDDTGLRFEIDVPDTTYGRDALVSIKRSDVNQMSFGFFDARSDWEDQGGMIVRTVVKSALREVSPVTWAAYTDTSIGLRAAGDAAELAAELAARVMAVRRGEATGPEAAALRSALGLADVGVINVLRRRVALRAM